MAEDEKQNQLAQAWTSYLSTRPLGVSYFGATDKVTPNLIMVLQSLAQRISQETGKPISFTSGLKIIADPSAAKNAINVPKPKVEETKLETETKPEETKPEELKTEENTMVLAWKQYLKSKGMYSGDVTSGDKDNSFSQGMAKLEGILSVIIPTTKGMVWDGTSVKATPQEYDEAMKLASEFNKKAKAKHSLLKKAQATLDAIGPPPTEETIEDAPSATNLLIGKNKSERSYHPWYSEHNGVSVNKLPGSKVDEDLKYDDKKPTNKTMIEANQAPIQKSQDEGNTNVGMNIDDRMVGLVKLIEETKDNNEK